MKVSDCVRVRVREIEVSVCLCDYMCIVHTWILCMCIFMYVCVYVCSECVCM